MFELCWRPFLLNPDMPRAGMARSDYVIRKFGGEERARRLYGSITEIGMSEGVEFRFDRIRRTPSSVDAHRLVRWAATYGRSSEVAEALFAAHFADGYDIGDHAILRAIASGAGLDSGAAAVFLRSDDDVDAVHADNLRAHRLGINGVPCFVIAGRHAIAGAQEPEVIERLLDVAAVDAPTFGDLVGRAPVAWKQQILVGELMTDRSRMPRLGAAAIMLLAADTLGIGAAAAVTDVTPAQAAALELQVREGIAGVLGPSVLLSDRPVQITAAGDHFDVIVPTASEAPDGSGKVRVTAIARPATDGTWAVENIRVTSPLRFTYKMPVPAEDGRASRTSMPVVATVNVEGQAGRIFWDPSFATPSTWAASNAG